MNERVKELAEQAGGIGHDDDGNELTPILVGKDLEKFAELIVRECAQIADDGFASSNFGNGITGHQLLRHFGVEE